MTTGNITPQYQFNRNSPFYPLIHNYCVLLLGFKELTAQGAALKLQGMAEDELQRALQVAGELRPTYERLLKADAGELSPPLNLTAEMTGDEIRIDATSIKLELLENVGYLISYLRNVAAGSLLIHAYEATRAFHDRGLLWEFLRHCRNAGAHGGNFHFLNNEPVRPAVWGRFSIVSSMHGTPLITNIGSPGFLAPGDPIRLLWDIEQAYPAIIIP